MGSWVRVGGRPGRAVAAAILAALLAAGVAGERVSARAAGCHGTHWLGAWSASPTDVQPGMTFAGQTVRVVVTPLTGGSVIRVRLSNRYGTRPLLVERVFVGLQSSGAALVPGSNTAASFGREPRVTIPPGDEVASDPLTMAIEPLEPLVVSVSVSPFSRALATRHLVGMQTSHVSSVATGVIAEDETGLPFTATSAGASSTHPRFFVSGIDVQAPSSHSALVAFGDSLTDGLQASSRGFGGPAEGVDLDVRYPDFLARRLLGEPRRGPISVLNAGISGNLLTAAGPVPAFGPSGLARLRDDVILQPGVADVLLLHGLNDLGVAGPKSVIAGLRRAIGRLRAQRLNVLIGTLTPFGAADRRVTGKSESERRRVNRWIRDQRLADGVVDFDQALRARADHTRLRPRYDSGDGLHPSTAGYEAMANAVKLSDLEGSDCRRRG